MKYETLLFDVRDNVATITLNRPDAANALNGDAARELSDAALICDIILAAESARFMMAYTRAGLTPDGSATYFLPRIVGAKRALELTLTNRMLSAQEAADWGIVARVIPDEQLLDEARQLAARLASGPTRAFGKAKHLLERAWTETLETQMETEGRTIADSARTADAREGIAAFLEKRPPRFRGE
jgi:2-(1,2-epoxy-1,2-dihydrophenyl)acetyl-CoA isomerase